MNKLFEPMASKPDTSGNERKTLYVKPFWDQFERKRTHQNKDRWRNDFNKA